MSLEETCLLKSTGGACLALQCFRETILTTCGNVSTTGATVHRRPACMPDNQYNHTPNPRRGDIPVSRNVRGRYQLAESMYVVAAGLETNSPSPPLAPSLPLSPLLTIRAAHGRAKFHLDGAPLVAHSASCLKEIRVGNASRREERDRNSSRSRYCSLERGRWEPIFCSVPATQRTFSVDDRRQAYSLFRRSANQLQ